MGDKWLLIINLSLGHREINKTIFLTVYNLKRLKNTVISVVELAYIKKCAIGCMDNTITLWNI